MRPVFKSSVVSVFSCPFIAKFAGMLTAVLILAACESAPEKPTLELSGHSMDQVPTLLEKAGEAKPDERAPILLDAVAILIANDEIDWARNIITGLSPAALEDTTYARHQLLASQLAVKGGYQFLAESHITEQRLLEVLPKIPTALAIAVREHRAQVFMTMGDYQASIQERVILDRLLAESPDTIEEERHLNNDILWETLMQLSYEELSELQQQAQDPTLLGWYSLACASKSNQSNLNRQLSLVDQWAQQWPEHPANKRLPADLQLLRDLVANQPRKIALLLPLSGKLEQASIAIRDGFMAAFYDASQNEEFLPDVRIYDTSSGDINAIYDQAVTEGAQAIIGPLEKESIAELALRLELPVPTLALNYVDAGAAQANLQHLYQFGLAIEDEAQQVAQQAWQDGHRRAMIIAPPSSWGDRSVISFWNEWKKLGGELIRDYRFDEDEGYLEIIASALHISDSRERAQQVRRILGRTVEFEPRRRRDVDMIFLVAYSQQARQIKPTLAFHYAANIPVYATSQVYSGDDQNNQDMNGIRFTSLPWFFEENAPEKQALTDYGNTAISYQRLYAMGADAFHLYPRLRQLREVTGARYYGYTGALSLNPSGKIERQQIWAKFIGGDAELMPALSENEES